MLRRPGIAAALALTLFSALVVLSLFKFSVTWMTLGFLDILIVDSDTVAFLLKIFPDLNTPLIAAAVLVIPSAALIWRVDPFRVATVAAAAVVVPLGLCRPCRFLCRKPTIRSRAQPGVELRPIRRARRR